MTRRPSGFTVIELMIVVTVIGLLSSVALPTFRNLQLRSKQAERSVMVKSIETALQDYWLRDSKWPHDAGGGTSYLTTSWSPTFPPTTQKRPFMKTAAYGDWNRLSLEVDGNVYYSYYAYAYATSGYRYQYVYAYGDLDGDRQYNYTYDYGYTDSSTSPPTDYRYSYDSAVDTPAL